MNAATPSAAHVARVRKEIEAKTYETAEKHQIAADRLLDELLDDQRAAWDARNEQDRFDGGRIS